MITVHKFPLHDTVTPPEDVVTLSMPRGAVPLHLGAQHDVLTLWALVDTEAPKTSHRFRVCGTGHPFVLDHSPETSVKNVWEASEKYVGTTSILSGRFIAHVFDLGEIRTKIQPNTVRAGAYRGPLNPGLPGD